MADGLLSNAMQALKNQYQETKGNVGLLMSDPKRYMSGLNQDAAEYNRLSSLALQAERNAYRGLPVSAEQTAAKQYIDQQQQDMALGFTGSIKPVGGSNFKNWFQESKVVDESKAPLTVYTGSKANIEEFSPQSDFGKISPTYWFSTNPKVASGYAMDPTRKGESLGAVYPAKLSLQNPLVIDAKNNNWDNITINNDALKLKGFEAGKQKASTDYIAYIARQNGYDGLIIKNAKDNPVGVSGEISDVYTAFKPEQIKSIFNRGTYDPKDKRILYSAAPVGLIAGQDQLELKKEKKPKK
jgi:hypothetical protein